MLLTYQAFNVFVQLSNPSVARTNLSGPDVSTMATQ
jgi:hypothetical protein